MLYNVNHYLAIKLQLKLRIFSVLARVMPDESNIGWNSNVLILRFKFRIPEEGRKNTKKIYINPIIKLAEETYEINAAILHHGRSGESGHYTSLAKMDATWFAIDDHVWKVVKNIKKTLRDIQGGYSNCSYVLMYIKREHIVPTETAS